MGIADQTYWRPRRTSRRGLRRSRQVRATETGSPPTTEGGDAVKPNILLYAALMTPRDLDVRCCTDEPRFEARPQARPAALRRWSSKLRVAVPTSFRVFGGAVRQPIHHQVPAGTQVRTPAGRTVGRVREVVVALPSGRASYAVDRAEPGDARVLLIPREDLRTSGSHAVVDERVLAGLARTAA
jgi:hypothetical protein